MSKLPNIPSNKKCWLYLNRLVFGSACQCPGCKATLQERYVRKYLWCKTCRKKYRATAYKGSWLYGTKLKPRQLFALLWAWQNRKSPDTACLLARVSYLTVGRWYGRFRERLPEAAATLRGLVQIDESYFGRQRSRQPQLIVTGAIEPDTRKVCLRITNARSQEALERFVQDNIKQGTLVVSDKWYAYEELPLLGYGHESWNHSTGQFAGTNQIEGLWSSMKRHLNCTAVSPQTTSKLSATNGWLGRTSQAGSPRQKTSYGLRLFRIS